MSISYRYRHFGFHVFPNWLNEKLGRRSVYTDHYDQKKLILIHTPKTAGTSLSKVLYGSDPWHYSSTNLRFISPTKFRAYRKVAFVRNPFSRLLSTYNYALYWVNQNPNSSIKFVTAFPNFEDFVMNGLSESIVRNHYFFWTYWKYLSLDDELAMDEVGRFEHFESEVKRIFPEIETEIPRINVGKGSKDYRNAYSQAMIQKVTSLYKEDLKQFNYEF